MALSRPPMATASMVIRRPIKQVYAAFIDPAITTKFWFSRASGPLETGKTISWHWDHYNLSCDVYVKSLRPNQQIDIEWPTPVVWEFYPQPENATYVRIKAYDFTGDEDQQMAQALDSTEGFNLVIASCKAYLEYGIELNAVNDKKPLFPIEACC